MISVGCLQLTAADQLILVSEGEPRAAIYLPPSPNPSEFQAAKEVAYWIKRISGAEVPILEDSQWDGEASYISVGRTAMAHEAGIYDEAFDQEEARVKIDQNGVILAGNDVSRFPSQQWTGTYYAALEFVRKCLGAYWIWPGELGEVFEPRTDIIVETPQYWTWKPTIREFRRLRNSYSQGVVDKLEEMLGVRVNRDEWAALHQAQEQWLKRERMAQPTNIRFGHAFTDYWDQFGETHPEWFARPPEGTPMRGGKGVKFNLSNEELQNHIFETWKAEWEADPIASQYLNLSPNDSRGYDTRPETRAWDAPQMQSLSDSDIYGSNHAVLSDRYVRFWNIFARRIREVDPNAKVTTYAYRNYRQPPLTDIQVENNIIIGYVGGEGFYPDEPFIREEWMEWARRGASLLWRPNLLHSGHGTPYLYSRQLYDDFKLFQENNLLGTDFDALVGNWGNQGLIYYVLAEQHSRPEASYETLADEYYAAFGPAKDAMRRYHEYFEEQTWRGPDLLRKPGAVSHLTWGGWWRGHMYLVPMFMTDEVIAKGRQLLEEAKLAVADAPEIYRQRVAFVEKGLDNAELTARAFGEIGLDNPGNRIRFDSQPVVEALRPLWRFRMENLTSQSVPSAYLLMLEQRSLGIWSGYQNVAEEGSKADLYPLNTGWQVLLDPERIGRWDKWYERPPARGWRDVSVGMPWRRALQSQEESKVVWYRCEFPVPDLEDTGEKVRLRFESVDAEVRVWLNGTLVLYRGYPHDGNYESWAEPFEVDISGQVRSGGTNSMVLEVISESQNAGITGPVNLLIGG